MTARFVLFAFAACLLAESIPTTTDRTHGVVWRAGDAKLGKWRVASSSQCGSPLNLGTRFVFSLSYVRESGSGTCVRNQANPLTTDGDTFYLRSGTRYTWTFRFMDGNAYIARAALMGFDHDARSLIWQIHGNVESGSPCTGLTFTNGSDNVTYDHQMWGFSTCKGVIWHGRYEPGETDDWKIVAVISSNGDGMTQLFRNGVLQCTDRGANYHDSHATPGDPEGFPWWNFGPYKWIWKDAPTNSSLTSVSMTIDAMELTSE